MFDARLLIRGSANSSVYSPWFPRGGDDCRDVMGALLAEVLSSAASTVRLDESGRSVVRFRLPQDVWERAGPVAEEGKS